MNPKLFRVHCLDLFGNETSVDHGKDRGVIHINYAAWN